MLSIFSSVTVGERIKITDGRASGFDYLRFVLAVSVIIFHSAITSYGAEQQERLNSSILGGVVNIILPMFFALSGFLVAGSLERSKSISVFLGLRLFRIVPALAVDTAFCALLLGPLMTTLPLANYANSAEFHAYFLNIIGDIHFTLPGVFQANPSKLVNGQLWTIPVELECYLVLTGLALLGFHRKKSWLFFTVIFLTTLLEGRVLGGMSAPWASRQLLLCFITGVLFFAYRDQIRLSMWAFCLAVSVSFACVEFQSLQYLAGFPVAYVTVYLGLRNPTRWNFLQSGDYSYGLFLYGFPIQQLVVALFPMVREWYWNSLICVPLALLFAMASWHLVEKRVLARKTHIFSARDQWGNLCLLAKTKLLARAASR